MSNVFYNHDSLLIPSTHPLLSSFICPPLRVLLPPGPSSSDPARRPPSAKATFAACRNTYLYLTPDLWTDFGASKNPYHEHSDYLASKGKKH
jgi:hypothetical protein